MAKKMINSKDNTHGLFNGVRQQPIVVKKSALQDLQNNIAMVLPKPMARSGPSTDPIKLSGAKRPAPPSPPCDNNSINWNYVYIRRRSDQEPVKSNNDGNTSDAKSPQQRQFSDGRLKLALQQTQMQGPKVSCYSTYAPIPPNTSSAEPSLALTLGKPVNALSSSSTDLNRPASTPGVVSVDEHFRERFFKLQMFLKNYDNSSHHEEYNQMLRSLSAADRSKHAVDLEKRAIQLMFEETKELQRMKSLNILAKSAPKNNTDSTSTTKVPPGNDKAPAIDIQ